MSTGAASVSAAASVEHEAVAEGGAGGAAAAMEEAPHTGHKAPFDLKSPQGFTFTIKESAIAGAGLGMWASQDMPADTVIAEYSNRERGPMTIAEAVKRKDKTYLMRVGPGVYVIPEDDCPARYANDACNPARYNIKFVKLPELGRADVVTTRAIAAGEELFVNYGRLYWLKGKPTALA